MNNKHIKSEVDSIIIDMILEHFNKQSVEGWDVQLTGEEFQELADIAEQVYINHLINIDINSNEVGRA